MSDDDVPPIQFSDLLMVPSPDVESTGEVDGQFITYNGLVNRENDACQGFFSNDFKLPQGQVPFLKIIVDDTITWNEEEQRLYHDNKKGNNNNNKHNGKSSDNNKIPKQVKDFFMETIRYSSSNLYNYFGKQIPKAIPFNLTNTLIKAIAFHPYLKRIAVARDDDVVCVYDLQRTQWLPLRLSHEFQTNIKCLEWQPMSGSRLAIGCENGICLWRIVVTDGNNSNERQRDRGKAWMRLYATSKHHDIVSISWCPRGDLLASASPSSSDVMIWNVDTGLSTPLTCTYGHGVHIVRWSYNYYYLFAGAFTNKIFIWETRSWRCESWKLTNGMCQCATWSPDGELIVFSETGTSALWTLALHHTPPRIDGELMKMKIDVGLFYNLDLANNLHEVGGAKRMVSTERSEMGNNNNNNNNDTPLVHQDENGNEIYLNVRELAWSFDRRGQRLALTVTPMVRGGKGSDQKNGTNDDKPTKLDGDELIMIYNVFYRPKLRFSPSGFFRSSQDAKSPYGIHFWPACRNGALLASAWMNGVITVYPLLYRCQLGED